MNSKPSIFSLPFSSCFLDEIVRLWCEGEEAIEKGLILVPSRRAARHLTEAFLRKFDSKSVFLPRIAALGAFEEEAPLGANYLVDLDPAITPLERQSIFARLVLEKAKRQGRGYRIDIAWQLAGFLAELQDEADRAECDLKEKLPEVFSVFDGELAKHSRENLEFLDIVTKSWPVFLKERGLLNPIERQVRFVKETARLLKKHPYQHRIWAVGFHDIASGSGDLLESVLLQDKGRIILQGLDYSLSKIRMGETSLFDHLPPSHPQYMLAELLKRLKAKPEDVTPIAQPVDDQRDRFWNTAMLPADFFAKHAGKNDFTCPAGISEIEANESQHEARCIALSLCNAIADPKKTAALVTSDRKLIKRVSAELERFGVHTDSGPGTLLSDTVPAVFIRLILKIFEDGWRIQDCLALLKHPLCAIGMPRVECRNLARRLEKKIRIERRFFNDLQAVRRYFEEQKEDELDLKDFVEKFTAAFDPLLKLVDQPFAMNELIEKSIVTAETLAAYHDIDEDKLVDGAHALWSGEDGNKLAEHIASLMESMPQLGSADFLGIEKFFTQSLKSISIIGLHGFKGGQELAHPRIFILGMMEARLLSFDLTIIGSVTEGNLPPTAEPSPWLNRSLYKDVGLYPTQRRVGSSAYDFMSKVSGTGEVILSRSKRQGTTPLIESSWLVRAKALLGKPLPLSNSVIWERERAEVDPAPLDKPMPCPSNDAKPKQISLTAIDNLVNAPFVFYLEQILKLRKLDRLEDKGSRQNFGIIVHDGLEDFYNANPGEFPADGEEQIKKFLTQSLKQSFLPTILEKWTLGRIENIAAWIAEQELKAKTPKRRVFHEAKLKWDVPAADSGQTIKINGRLDRIDLSEKGEGAAQNIRIIDYKTGAVPKLGQVHDKEKMQLPIEAAALLDKVKPQFKHASAQNINLADQILDAAEPEDIALAYWQIKGAGTGNNVVKVKPNDKGVTNEALSEMKSFLSQQFGEYLQHNHIFSLKHHQDLYEDYRHLSRYEEWRGGTSRPEGDVA